MRICYLGMARPTYSRHRIISRGLRQLGVEVIECFVSPHLRGLDLQRALWQAYAELNGRFEALLVAEFNHTILPMTGYLARRQRLPVLYDFLVSLYDSGVEDRAQVTALSPKGLALWSLDWLATRLPTKILVDTSAHRDFYVRRFQARGDKFVVVPLGFEDDIFTAAPPRSAQPDFHILFYSSFIQSHGAEVIVRAAHLIDRTDPGIRFTLIGEGQTLPENKKLAAALQVRNLTFLPPVNIKELPAWIASADLTLGVFGSNQKASRAIPNKLYQGLAVGRPVITGDTLPAREFFTPGEHLWLCPVGSPEALAEAILSLKHDSQLRYRLSEQGRRCVVEKYSPLPIGRIVLEAIKDALAH